MKRGMLMVIAICSTLSMTPVGADDSGEAAFGSAPGDAAGVAAEKQIGESTGAMIGGAEGGSSGAAAGKAKPASTATATKYLYDQVQKGNIEIQGATDADIDE